MRIAWAKRPFKQNRWAPKVFHISTDGLPGGRKSENRWQRRDGQALQENPPSDVDEPVRAQ